MLITFTPGVLFETASTAEHLVHTTNQLTQLRSIGAPVAGILVAASGGMRPDQETLLTCGQLDEAIGAHGSRLRTCITVGAIVLSATDLEGNAFRLAKRIDPAITNPGGGERDQLADKKLFYSLMAGLVVRRYRQENPRDAAFMAGILAANLLRDKAMKHERTIASNNGISTDAMRINKAKTMCLLLGAISATTEWSESGRGQACTHCLLAGGTAIGAVGLYKYRSLIRSNQHNTLLQGDY